MQWLVEIGLSNAVAAAAIAVAAWIVGRIWDRPPLAHAVWLLVLLKLLTPPIIELPLPLPIGLSESEWRSAVNAGNAGPAADRGSPETTGSPLGVQPADAHATRKPGLASRSARDRGRAAAMVEPAPLRAERETSAMTASRRASDEDASHHNAGAHAPTARSLGSHAKEMATVEGATDAPITADKHASVLTPSGSTPGEVYARTVPWAGMGRFAIGLWMFGAAAWFTLQIALGLQLRRALRGAAAPPAELRRAAEQLARRMGLRHCPQIRVVCQRTSPMVVGLGRRASIVMPLVLLRRLSHDSQVTILAHELAHCRRGDQWVRLLELIATGLYWWHPVLWWARQRIEAAEEACCDAHVLTSCGNQPRVYAEAILDIVDLISEPVPTLRPAMSSGIRQRPLLQKRLRNLMEGRCVPTVTPGTRRMMLIAGALCLFYHPTFFITEAPTARATSALDDQQAIAAFSGPAAAKVALAANATEPDASQASGSAGDSQPPSAAEGGPAEETPVNDRPVWATAVSPNGRYQVSIRQGYRCERREVVSNHVEPLAGHRITCVAFAPDSERFVTGDVDGSVHLWDAGSGLVIKVLAEQQGAIHSVAFSPTGDRIAAAGEDGVIEILSTTAPAQRTTIARFATPIRCVRFSPNGARLAIATDTWKTSTAGTVAVFDLESHTVVTQGMADGPVGAVRFQPDGGLIVAEWSGRVVQWSLPRGRRTGTATIVKDLVSAASFSPDTRALETVAESLQPSFWEILW